MAKDTKAPLTSTGDTAPMKAAAGDTHVVRNKSSSPKSPVFPSRPAASFIMTYLGGPIPEGRAGHRLMEQYRGGGYISFGDKLPVMLFLAFQACAAVVALIIELSLLR